MTVKQFFKSRSFKCLAVLTCVLLISGIILTIAWGFLEVTDEMRFNRKIGAVYGGESVTATVKDISDANKTAGNATIDSIWYIEEKGDYLVQAQAKGNGGAIICWTVVKMSDDGKSVKGLGNVLIYNYEDPAEFVGYIGEEVYGYFADNYADGKIFSYGDKTSDEYIHTGASKTLTAVCDCVNGSVTFIKAYASGTTVADPFEGLTRTTFINKVKTSWTVSDDAIEYDITTTANSGPDPFRIKITVDSSHTVTAYEIVVNGCAEDGHQSAEDYENAMSATAKNLVGKNLEDIEGYLSDTTAGGALVTGATKSNQLCYEAAAFALTNYDAIIEREATQDE